MNPVVTTPAPGVTFLSITDERFTTARITMSFYVPLREETAGVHAVLPFLLNRGCRRFPTVTAFRRELERLYGASIYADVTGSGETQIVQLAMSCPDDRYALKGEALTAQCAELLLDMLFDPPLDDNGLFREQDVEQERRCTLESIAAEINEKRRYAVMKAKRLLCKGEPYAVSKYGTKESVEALTPADLTQAWRALLRTAPMRVVYQGPGDGKAVQQALADRLKEREVCSLPSVEMHPAKETVARERETMDVNQCQLVLGLRTPIAGDDPRCDAMRLANAVLGGTPQSLLFLHVREEHSLCYYCASRYDRKKGVILIDSGVQYDTLEQAECEILRQLDALKAGDFDDEMLENTRLSLLDTLMGAADSPAATADWYVTQGPDRLRSPEELAASIRTITREQVIEAAATIAVDCVYTLTPPEQEVQA